MRSFFLENNLQAVQRQAGKFTLWQHGRLSILRGDYFSLTGNDLGQIDTVYDLAALTALPEDIRKLYVAHLKRIVAETANLFLLTTEDAEESETPSQAFGVAEEITTLYSEDFKIGWPMLTACSRLIPNCRKTPGTYRVQSLQAHHQSAIWVESRHLTPTKPYKFCLHLQKQTIAGE